MKWEEDRQLNAGVDGSFFRNLLDISVDYYHTQADQVLMITPQSSVYGTSIYYSNDAAILAKGMELSLQATPVNTSRFSWIIGGHVTSLDNQVTSLGEKNETVLTLTDGAQLITRKGENPYAFYGYRTKGVFSTTEEANLAALTNLNGTPYEAGDVHFEDINGDHIINEADKVILGSATPDLYGAFYSRFVYRGFGLDLNFVYSFGNEAYNAVRRRLESLSDVSNQSKAVNRRWSMEGQVTDIPRAEWGDPVGNNVFSDRWIEDASYIKLRDVTFSYTFKEPIWNTFQSGMIYVTGENMFTWTNYLGLSPEFSYSYSEALQGVDYAKVVQPKTIKIGVNLKF